MVAETISVPATRFRSFFDEWKPRRLEEYFSPSRAKGTDGLPTLSVTINQGLVNRDDLERKQETNLTAKEHLLVRDGDIAYNMMRMWQGAFGRANSDGIVSPAYVVLRGKTGVDTRFFDYAFRRSRSIYLFWAYSYGLTKDRLRLYANDFTRIPFSVPTLPEQRKIADFLTAVDGRIGQLIQKKGLLEDYKKGVMQQLFTQAIRFKDDHGNDFPDWEEKKLGELCKITTGKLDANAMNPTGRYRFYTCAKDYLQIDDYAFDTEALLISGNGANVGYIHSYKGKFNAYQRTYVLDGFQEVISFIKFQLEVNLKRRIQLESKAGNIPYIVLGTLTDLPLVIPSVDEQAKIANFLSAIDRKIESVATQITETQTFKRGLLQQMFV